MQKLYFPGCPRLERSRSSLAPTRLISIRRTARPIVAFARFPGPKALVPDLMPIRFTIGPFTITKGAPPLVDAAHMLTSYSGLTRHSQTDKTIGNASGGHPAMTAFVATCSAVTI